MASFGEGFAGGLGQGMAMGKMLMDTYNEYDQKDKLKQAGELSPEEVAAGFTPNQQQTLEHISDPKNGYEVKKLDNGNVQFRTAGSENSWQDLEQGSKKWKLGDKTYDVAPTDDQIARARDDARAKVLMDAGDVKGAYGLKALAREDRSGNKLEELKDWKMTQLQNIAQGNYEPVLQELMPYYNKPGSGSKFDDGHHATIDPRTNAVVFSNDKGQVVAQHPINGKTLSEALNMAFDDKMSALDPKYGVDVRKANASEMSARADYEYKRAGGVAERVGMANVAARGDSSSKPNVRMAQVNVTDDQGVTTKQPISVVTRVGKDGVPVVQAYSLDGKPINDKKVMGQLSGDDGESVSTAGRNADLGAARKAFESGNMDYNTYQSTVTQINTRYNQQDTLLKLGNDFKTVEKNDGRDAAVRSIVAQVEGAVKNPNDKSAVYGQLGIKSDEILRAKRGAQGGTGLAAATNYSTQSTWQPGQKRKQVPENMQGN